MKKIILFIFLLISVSDFLFAQENKKSPVILTEGTLVAGYIDKGAFLNFTGPAIRILRKPTWAISVGMLPGLRIKKDNAVAPAKRNATIWPTLGTGITITIKHLALQLPVYYNAKTATTNGKWVPGFGIGYKFL